MEAVERFETPRLLLRAPQMSDARAIFRNYATDPEVTRFLMWKPHQTLEETHKFLAFCESGWSDNTSLTWAITPKGSDEPIGMFSAKNENYKTTIGYVLARQYWGQGIVAEAGKAFIELALQDQTLYRIWAFCDVENLTSARVLEKMGLKREAYLKRWVIHPNISAEPRDCISYSLTK